MEGESQRHRLERCHQEIEEHPERASGHYNLGLAYTVSGRVKQAEADQIVAAMKEKDIPVTYLLYPDEGHGFARPENRLSFYAVTEVFLAEHLGGKVEPIGNDFEGSSVKVLEGGEQIPDLPAVVEEEPETESAG